MGNDECFLTIEYDVLTSERELDGAAEDD